MSVCISAVVATRNRASYLRKALQSLVSQTLAREMYEIIVVDNGSRDSTEHVVDEFSGVCNLRYLYEPVAGVSRARNTGCSVAQGTYIAFLDDDAVAREDWLANFLDTFATFVPSPGCIGGRCLPIWEAPRPEWFSDRALPLFSIYHYADVAIVLNEEQWLSICNLAVPREVLALVKRFREDLGRHGNNLRANPEIYLRQQLDSLGYCSVYDPEIVVSHHIPRERLTKQWFRQRAYWQGRSNAIMLDSEGGLPFVFRVRQTLGQVGWLLPRLVLMLAEASPAASFRRQCQVVQATGYVSGLWHPEST